MLNTIIAEQPKPRKLIFPSLLVWIQPKMTVLKSPTKTVKEACQHVSQEYNLPGGVQSVAINTYQQQLTFYADWYF